MAKFPRSDLDGVLHASDPAQGRYVKHLPRQTAWHLTFVEELLNQHDSAVEAVVDNGEADRFELAYKPGTEPSDYAELRRSANPTGPLAVWRAATLMRRLAARLQNLHDESLPQGVVHPERTARRRVESGRIELEILATYSGVLPPLGVLTSEPRGAWWYYAAPELLRTRALEAETSYSADVYSLGRMISAICRKDPPPCLVDSSSHDQAAILAAIENRVENSAEERLEDWPESLREFLSDAVLPLCAARPADRPPWPQTLARLDAWIAAESPRKVFDRGRAEGRRDLSESCLRDLESAQKEQLFGDWSSEPVLMAVDLTLMKDPPDCAAAIARLEAVPPTLRFDVEVRLRFGRAYRRFTSHPGHLELCLAAYESALRSPQWTSEVTDEFAEVLRERCEPPVIIERTKKVPSARRTAKLQMLRADCYRNRNHLTDAWFEAADGFPLAPFDEGLFGFSVQLANEIVAAEGKSNLVRWMGMVAKRNEYAAPVSIVRRLLGDQAEANSLLDRARSYRPS